MIRVLQHEWLDALPPDDPAAAASRRDIRRLNDLMGHRRILAGALASAGGNPPRRMVELGAGDGSLALRLAASFAPRWPNVELLLVDIQKVVTEATLREFHELGWTAQPVTADALEWLEGFTDVADVIFVNLFLHHLSDEQLGKLFRLAARQARAVVALEPRRSGRGLMGCLLLRLIGCNHVTRHDAPASVRAGFRGNELSALWPAHEEWRLEERAAGAFSHLFVARRNAA